MKQSKEMQDAWDRLQEMAADDPATVSTMSRYLAALGVLIGGRRPREMHVPEPHLQAGFVMTTGQRDMLMAAAVRLDMDLINLVFDHDDAERPLGMVVVRLEDPHVVCYSRNALWSAPGSRRAVLVCLDQGPRCHFAFRRDARLEKVDGWPADDLAAGMRRAAGRLHRLAASDEMRDAQVGAFRQLVRFNKPGDWTVRTDQIAA